MFILRERAQVEGEDLNARFNSSFYLNFDQNLKLNG